MSWGHLWAQIFPTYVIALGALAVRHLASAFLWPRISRNERFYLSLPPGFQIKTPAPGGTFRMVRIWLLLMAIGAFAMPVMLACVLEVTDGGSWQPRLVAAANLCLIAAVYAIDRRSMRRWKARALG